MKIILSIIFLLFFLPLKAQTDWERWQAKEVLYSVGKAEVRDYSIDRSSFGSTVLSSIRNGYYFLISDLDGENCPFHPSCSAFAVEAIKETNILQGSLIFADRFTRDLNFVKNPNQYKIHEGSKLFDPYYNYLLSETAIFTNNKK